MNGKNQQSLFIGQSLIPAFLKTPPVRKQNGSPQTDRKSLPCTYLTKPFYPEDIKSLKFGYNEVNILTKVNTGYWVKTTLHSRTFTNYCQ